MTTKKRLTSRRPTTHQVPKSEDISNGIRGPIDLIERVTRQPAFWYYLSKFLPGAFSFASTIVLVRILGETQYGKLAICLAAATVTTGFASGWISPALLRASGVHRLDSLPLWLRIGTCSTAGPISVAIAASFGDRATPLLLATTLCLAVSMSAQSLTCADLQSAGHGRF